MKLPAFPPSIWECLNDVQRAELKQWEHAIVKWIQASHEEMIKKFMEGGDATENFTTRNRHADQG
jgi:hypothetical protein